MTALLVILGAAIGAPARFLIDRAVQTRHDSAFPWGTFTVNLVGCLGLGFLIGLPLGDGIMALAGVGFCGALTTWSTFSYETFRLLSSRARLLAALNVAASVIGGLGAAYCGLALAQALTA